MQDIFLSNKCKGVGLPDPEPADWAGFYRAWLEIADDNARIPVVKHEILSAERTRIWGVLHRLGYEVSEDKVDSEIGFYEGHYREEYNLKYAQGYSTPQTVCAGSSQWKRHITGDALELMRQYWIQNEDLLERLGYQW